jgi:hypothetical protein
MHTCTAPEVVEAPLRLEVHVQALNQRLQTLDACGPPKKLGVPMTSRSSPERDDWTPSRELSEDCFLFSLRWPHALRDLV